MPQLREGWWRWENGSFQLKLMCPNVGRALGSGCCSERVVSIGPDQGVDISALLEASDVLLVETLAGVLRNFDIRCGNCGVKFGARDSAIAEFCRAVSQDIVTRAPWLAQAREYGGVRATIERRLHASRGGGD